MDDLGVEGELLGLQAVLPDGHPVGVRGGLGPHLLEVQELLHDGNLVQDRLPGRLVVAMKGRGGDSLGDAGPSNPAHHLPQPLQGLLQGQLHLVQLWGWR